MLYREPVFMNTPLKIPANYTHKFKYGTSYYFCVLKNYG